TADFAKIRNIAEKIRAELEHVLSAKIWTRGHVAPSFTFNCTECDTPIRRTIEVLKKGDEVECGNCGNLFDAVHDEADDGWSIHLKAFTWTCRACDTPRQIPQKEAKGGLDVSRPKCKNRAWL